MIGIVTLVGAGCGDFDLITLRGLEALRICDTVIYDNLIDERLLKYCPENSEKIYVGKSAGLHSRTQEEINSLIVQKALQGKNVVRLKGGDPFVFGRGGEEIIALQKHEIPYSIIPGITSAVAVPELLGIPVTHRKTARSFHVVTGHTADDILPENLDFYAKCGGTLVFMMGLKNLSIIADSLIKSGMSAKTPAAVISKGGSAQQRIVKADLGSINAEVEKMQIETPVVIVIGETAALDFSPTYKPPLNGISVAVTATPELSQRIIMEFNRLGAYAFRVGSFDTTELYGAQIDNAFMSLSDYSWLAFSSSNGVKTFLKKLKDKRIDIRILNGIKLAAIGNGTAWKLEDAGLIPDLIPQEFTTAALGKALTEAVKSDEKLLILRSCEGSDELIKPLSENGIAYDDVHIYAPVYGGGEAIAADYAVFTSAGGVRSFFTVNGALSPGTKAVAIGKVAAAELMRFGISECIIPKESTVSGIINKILEEVKCKDLDV